MDYQSVLDPRETVIVVTKASKESNLDALDWALNHVVRPRDTILVLGILHGFLTLETHKISCFPFKFFMGISNRISGIWSKRKSKEILQPNVTITKSYVGEGGLEFEGQGDVNPRELEEELEERRIEYQSSLQPFYELCIKNKVKLDVKIAAGFCSKKLTVQEAQRSNARWIIIDSQLKKDRVYVFGHVSCNVAVMKGKDEATLLSKDAQRETFSNYYGDPSALPQTPPNQSPCWYPLSWRSGFPRIFSWNEIEVIANSFSAENFIQEVNDIKVYQGLLQKIPVIVKCFLENDQCFWSMLTILSRVRHRNIRNLVGYCCDDASRVLLFDYPCNGTLDMNLQCNEFAQKLGWRARWCIALEIGGSLRYLHEECTDGAIVHHSVSASHIVLSHHHSAMLSNFTKAKWHKDDVDHTEDFIDESSNVANDERLFIDVYDYGKFLVELITGESTICFQKQEKGSGKTLIEWALPLLEDGLLNQVMDSRPIENTSDIKLVENMATAAIHCLKIFSSHKFSVSEALAKVRGNELAIFES